MSSIWNSITGPENSKANSMDGKAPVDPFASPALTPDPVASLKAIWNVSLTNRVKDVKHGLKEEVEKQLAYDGLPKRLIETLGKYNAQRSSKFLKCLESFVDGLESCSEILNQLLRKLPGLSQAFKALLSHCDMLSAIDNMLDSLAADLFRGGENLKVSIKGDRFETALCKLVDLFMDACVRMVLYMRRRPLARWGLNIAKGGFGDRKFATVVTKIERQIMRVEHEARFMEAQKFDDFVKRFETDVFPNVHWAYNTTNPFRRNRYYCPKGSELESNNQHLPSASRSTSHP